MGACRFYAFMASLAMISTAAGALLGPGPVIVPQGPEIVVFGYNDLGMASQTVFGEIPRNPNRPRAVDVYTVVVSCRVNIRVFLIIIDD